MSTTPLDHKSLAALQDGARVVDEEGDVLRRREGSWYFEDKRLNQNPFPDRVLLNWGPVLLSDGPGEPEPGPLTVEQAFQDYKVDWSRPYQEAVQHAFAAGWGARI